MKNPPQFVLVALRAAEMMGIQTKDQKILMRFCKMYKPEKIALIISVAKKFDWWRKNPIAAFMKAVGIVNKQERLDK